MSSTPATEKKSWIDRSLDAIERVCNKLPPPGILFIYLFVIVAVIGAVVAATGATMTNPANGELVAAKNFFSGEGVQWLLKNMLTNFTGFAPLGLVITMTLAIGFCEESGLIMALLKNSLKNIPPVMVPYVVAFVGTCGNIASDTAMVVIPPVAAVLYIAAGKHPVVGMICGYAGAQAGFSANLMIAGTDSLLQGITNNCIQGFLGEDTTFMVDVTCNWFFMFASTFLCGAVIGWACNKFADPRFGKYEGDTTNTKLEDIAAHEKKALNAAGIAALLYIAVIVVGYFFGPLAKIDEDGTRHFVGSPLLSGLIPVLFFLFSICGITYGFVAKKFGNVNDVNKAMVKQMNAMGSYVVFCFFCGQFQKLFSWTKLDTMLAISGANALSNIGFTGIPLFVTFILLCMCINLFISSGSAKWAILAPIFVPMFMLLGYHPGFTQLLYRIGDSPTNCFTPMSPYIWMVLEVAKTKYDKDLKIGSLTAALVPIAFALQIAWILFMIVYYLTGLPIGPGMTYTLPAGVL